MINSREGSACSPSWVPWLEKEACLAYEFRGGEARGGGQEARAAQGDAETS